MLMAGLEKSECTPSESQPKLDDGRCNERGSRFREVNMVFTKLPVFIYIISLQSCTKKRHTVQTRPAPNE